ncbi:MAG: RagB/SusD family nutrient uptake outer membrane protein [Bacteroidetes bacterium]|nr:RagB/SusD family nutrient uptake outer membrane protein [Bacteroidota bacterium]
MKKFIIISIALVGILSSCKKSWLEIVPIGQQVLTTTDDYDKTMNDPNLYNTGVTGWAEAQLMGDEMAAEGAYFVNKGSRDYRDRFFMWKDSIYPTADVNPFVLMNHLTRMYQINKVINEVMGSAGGSDAQKKGILAEALATRAWSNFTMANYYCKPYVASTASADPGFPIITVADVNTSAFPRGTVQQFYDFMVKDLTDALANIPMKQSIVTRWSKPAVEGYLGKVYMFMGKYTEALSLLKAALDDVSANGQTSLYDYNVALAPGGSFLPVTANSGPSNNPGNLPNDIKEAVVSKVFNSGAYSGNYTGNDGMRLAPQAQALYGPTDLRLQLYINKNEDNSVNAAGRLRKYGVSYSRWGLQLADLLLLSAECKARTNDLAGAVTDVQTLRKNRMPVADAAVPAATAGNQTALIKFIIDERVREFAMEGYRWFDMRRLSVDPLFSGMTFTHTIYNANGTTTVYTMDQPKRLVMKLPRVITDGNPDMQNNP